MYNHENSKSLNPNSAQVSKQESIIPASISRIQLTLLILYVLGVNTVITGAQYTEIWENKGFSDISRLQNFR